MDASNRIVGVKHPATNLVKRILKVKSRIAHLFHNREHFDNKGFAGTSS